MGFGLGCRWFIWKVRERSGDRVKQRMGISQHQDILSRELSLWCLLVLQGRFKSLMKCVLKLSAQEGRRGNIYPLGSIPHLGKDPAEVSLRERTPKH